MQTFKPYKTRSWESQQTTFIQKTGGYSQKIKINTMEECLFLYRMVQKFEK